MAAVEESGGGGNCVANARGSSAAPPEPRHQHTVAETDDTPTDQQQCEHFSIRGYFALLQKKDPTFCSLVPKFRRWNCSSCSAKAENPDYKTSSSVSMKQKVISDGCSIRFVRSTLVPASVGFRSLFPWTQQSSQGKNNAAMSAFSKSAQESNSRCNLPSSGNKGVTEANNNPPTKDLQGVSYSHHDVTANTSENAPVDVVALPKVSHITENKGGGTEIPYSLKHSEISLKPIEDDNGKAEETLLVDCNTTDVLKTISVEKGDQVCNGTREKVASKRRVKTSGKKKRKRPTTQDGVSDVKHCPRKQKKVRLLSEIINNDQVRGSSSDTEVLHGKIAGDEDDRSRNDVIPDSNQTVVETQSQTTNNEGLGFDDDGYSLVNWLKRVPKKLRSGKKDSEHKGSDSSATKSKPTEDVFASTDMQLKFISSVGKLGKRKTLLAITAEQGENNIQSNDVERNVQNTGDMCQVESQNSTQRCSSKVKAMSLSKEKMPSTFNAHYESNEQNTVKRTTLRIEDQCQVQPENSVQMSLAKVSSGKGDMQQATVLEHKLPEKRKKQKPESTHEKHTLTNDIPMDDVGLLVKNQQGRQLRSETDSSDVSHTHSKITADGDCSTVAAMDGLNFTSTVLHTDFQQKSSASQSNMRALQDNISPITEATSMHPLKLQIPGDLKSTQERQAELCTEDVTIARMSPLLSHHKDQYNAEALADCWSRKGTKSAWDSFKKAPRDPSTATRGAQVRPSIQTVDLTSTHVTGAYNNYATHQPIISALDHGTSGAVNQVQARSFPSAISTMEAGHLCDRRNAGQSGLYPNETMPATHLLRLADSSTLAGFPNYGTSNLYQMEFQLRNSQYAHNQYKGSTSAVYGSNLNGKVPLTLQDLSRHTFQQNMNKPLRPHPRVGVFNSMLQKEIANWGESRGTESGYTIGVSKGITPFDMNRKESAEALNSRMFSARCNELHLGSVSSRPELLSARNSIAPSWVRCQGKVTRPLDRFVRHDICVTNRNPADFTTISDNNEYIRDI